MATRNRELECRGHGTTDGRKHAAPALASWSDLSDLHWQRRYLSRRQGAHSKGDLQATSSKVAKATDRPHQARGVITRRDGEQVTTLTMFKLSFLCFFYLQRMHCLCIMHCFVH